MIKNIFNKLKQFLDFLFNPTPDNEKNKFIRLAMLSVMFMLFIFVGVGAGCDIQKQYIIKPTDNPQTIIDNAPAGSKITFADGVHEHSLSKYNSMIYIDKPLIIEIPSSATLRVLNNSVNVNKNAEVITNFHTNNPVTNLKVNSEGYNLGNTVRTYEIKIDSVGTKNTFKYQIRDFNNKVVKEWTSSIKITGSFQPLSDGLQIKFNDITRLKKDAGCIIAVGSPGYSVIRIGQGIQGKYIDGVKIIGSGIIDQNQNSNAYSNLYALGLNTGLLIDGRVKNCTIDGLNFKDCNRAIVALGENVGGKFNLDGTVIGGISYDVDTLSIKNTKSYGDCLSGVLFGMPEHRGYVKNLSFDDNEVHCNLTGIEPNNLLQNYNIINNKIWTQNIPIACWRYSKNGIIEGNIAYNTTSSTVVTIATPAGWKLAENIQSRNNRIISK